LYCERYPYLHVSCFTCLCKWNCDLRCSCLSVFALSIKASESLNNKLHGNRWNHCVFADGYGWSFYTGIHKRTFSYEYFSHRGNDTVFSSRFFFFYQRFRWTSTFVIRVAGVKLFQSWLSNAVNVMTQVAKRPVSLCGPHPSSYLYSPRIYLKVFLFSPRLCAGFGCQPHSVQEWRNALMGKLSQFAWSETAICSVWESNPLLL
jgi:hypothetical protein